MSSLARFYTADDTRASSLPSSALASLLRSTADALRNGHEGSAAAVHPQTAQKAASASLGAASASASSGKEAKYTVTAYYAAQFDAFRQLVCEDSGAAAPAISSYVASLCRCVKWKTRGGKSNAYFAKTMDDRFVIKQLSKSELQSFLDFAPQYFRCASRLLARRAGTAAHAHRRGGPLCTLR